MDKDERERLKEIEQGFTSIRDNLGGLVALINLFMETGTVSPAEVSDGDTCDNSKPLDVMIWVMRSAIQEIVGMAESHRQKIVLAYVESAGPPPGEIVE